MLELFVGKEELLPVWIDLLEAIQEFGGDVRVRPRERYIEIDRRGSLFAVVEPTADHRLELGLHNPGLPYDERFRPSEGWGQNASRTKRPCPRTPTSTAGCMRASTRRMPLPFKASLGS